MIFPSSYTAALLVLIFAMVCLGSWANTLKLSGKWRFELFYYDFALGAVLCAVVAAFTLGTLNSQELTFQDNLLIASRRQMAYAFGAGMVFNLSNMLLLGAMQASGMAIAFPAAFGLALAIGAIVSYFENPQTSAMLLFAGALLILVAIALIAYAYGSYLDAQREAKPLRPDPRAPRAARPRSAALGVTLGLVSGVLLTLYRPIVEMARTGETAVSAYSLALLFGGGVLVSTLLYAPFFLNFPVQGGPLEMGAYFKGTKRQHLLGLLGGILWMAGTLAAYTAAGGPSAAQPGPIETFALLQGATLIAALWGLLVWREFAGATDRVKMLLIGMLVIFAAGTALITMAPVYGK